MTIFLTIFELGEIVLVTASSLLPETNVSLDSRKRQCYSFPSLHCICRL